MAKTVRIRTAPPANASPFVRAVLLAAQARKKVGKRHGGGK